jgi:hypothetical protein
MSRVRVRRGNSIWDELDEKYGLLDQVNKQGLAEISAAQIKALRGEEARLLTKYDTRDDLPDFFRRNNLAILPTNRGSYALGRFDLYEDIPQDSPQVEVFKPRVYPDALKVKAISSEAAAVNLLYSSGLLEEFAGESGLLPAVSGRMSAGHFEYEIADISGGSNYSMKASAPQIEIDAGFEGNNSLILIEAKKDRLNSFNVRQVYFPFIAWQSVMHKKVRNIFFIHKGDEFELLEYEFKNTTFLGQLSLVAHKKFVLSSYTLSPKEIVSLSNSKVYEKDYLDLAPYPQADSVNKLFELVTFLEIEDRQKQAIADKFGFNTRQSDYYCNALKLLGLAERSGRGVWTLSAEGFDFASKSSHAQHVEMAMRMLRVPALRRFCQDVGGQLGTNIEKLIQYIEDDFLHPSVLKRKAKTDSDQIAKTVGRRQQTVISWCAWLNSIVG